MKNTDGITKRWVDGEDDRALLAAKVPLSTRASTDLFLDGLWELVASRRRTKFVGFGVFEWHPWRNRLPTGKVVKAWRLSFKPSKYVRRYKGRARK